MKRNEIVKVLISEGFTEKTLVKFSDKQITNLYERIIGEADIMISKKDPKAQQKIADAKKLNKSIETYEEEIEESDVEDSKNKKNEMKEWLQTVAESNFHSFTSKGEIMELIQTKMDVNVGPKVKKGHNGIPEFMSYDSISKTEVKEQGTTTKPKTIPTTKPTTRPKPKTPYQPGPGTNPKPKALKETKKNANK